MKTIEHFQPRNECHIVLAQLGDQIFYASSLLDTGKGLSGMTSPRRKGRRTTITFEHNDIIAHFEARNLDEVDEILTRNDHH